MAGWRCVDISKWVCTCSILLGLDLGEKSNFRRQWIWNRLFIWVDSKNYSLACTGWRTCSKDGLYFMEIIEGIQEGKNIFTYFNQWLLHLAFINYLLCKDQYTDLFPEGFTDWNKIMLASGSGSVVNLGFFLSVFIYLSSIYWSII